MLFEKAKERLTNAFGKSAKDLIEIWGIRAAGQLKKGNPVTLGARSYPATNATIRSGKLARALQGFENSTDSGAMEGEVIVDERTIHLPSAHLLERGGTFAVTPRQRAFFFYKASQSTGREKEIWLMMGRSATLTHRPLPYIYPALMKVKDDDFIRIVKKRIKEQFPDKKKEVVVGSV